MSEPNAKIIEDDKSVLRDALENLIANMGTSQDKRAYSKFNNNKRLSATGNKQELTDLYRTNWLAGKIVDIIPEDMTREWREFNGDIDPKTIGKLVAEEDRLQLSNAFCQAHKWARLYGTSFIIMSIDDGQTPDKPLDIKRIKKGGLRHIKVVDRHRLNHADQQPVADPLNPYYGFPEMYRFHETSVRIHCSRVLRFDGIELPFTDFRENNYFSDSILDRLYDDIINLTTVTTGAATMVYDTNVDIMKIKGLMDYLQSAEGEILLRKRFTLAGLQKSFNNMLLLDNEEDYTSKTNTFAGLPDLIDRYNQLVTAGADVPATRLFGSSATGFNATGEGDQKNYYDKLKSDQKTDYKPRLDYFDKIMAQSLGIGLDADLSYEFVSLFQMTPKEQAELEFSKAQRDQIYHMLGVIDELVIAKELNQDGTYSNITDDFIEELENALDTDTEEDEFNLEPGNESGEEEALGSDESA